ncbi:MAG: YihY/virulence factor BrkB family protein [Pirellulaceae bacterium]|nr:YihY/virulence factor BrkB family protein [Pirellulaceae bacterium]
MMSPMKLVRGVKVTFANFVADDCPTLAAALAYYTVFSLPPLIFLLVTVLTLSLSLFSSSLSAEERAKRIVVRHASTILGNETIQEEVAAILTTNEQESRSWWKSLLGIAAVLVGASGVLSALQNALNKVWKVAPRTGSHQALHFLLKRIISLTMVLGFGFILIVSFVVNSVIEVVLNTIGNHFGATEGLANLANHLISFLVITVLLGAMYRYLPDARIHWRDVLLAAVLASMFFSLGRALLQWYFELANPAAQLGSAAASLAAILIWVYYTSMIMLLGAEFSKTWAQMQGRRVMPEPGAQRVA